MDKIIEWRRTGRESRMEGRKHNKRGKNNNSEVRGSYKPGNKDLLL